MDAVELMGARLAVREEKECSVDSRVKAACGEKYDPMMIHDSKRDVLGLLGKKSGTHSNCKLLGHEHLIQEKRKNKTPERER